VTDQPGSGPPSAPAPQRRWQAPCPNCGAPVPFTSPASAAAVCGYCRSTVVRDGEALRKIGDSAELFGNRSALQLGTGGRHEGHAFTIVGRLQLGYGDTEPGGLALVDAVWNEWHLAFDDGSDGWLSEDNDQYVLVRPAAVDEALPYAQKLQSGMPVRLAGRGWRVASVVEVRVLSAEGELPRAPDPARRYPVVDLRNERGEVATIEYDDAEHPALSIGSTVRLGELALTGLRDGFEDDVKAVHGNAFDCPSCGSPVTLARTQSQSISCGNCLAVIDVSKGSGAALVAFQQAQRIKPKIPLGSTGTLAIHGGAALPWQVVGFSVKHARTEDASENFNWHDYLLYNRDEGFAFLIDSDDGWVLYRTLTDVPSVISDDRALWNGVRYTRSDSYQAEVRYVEGEFYWRLTRGKRAGTTDYCGAGSNSWRLLSREVDDDEVIWSYGERVSARQIGDAFRLPALAARSADVSPTSGAGIPAYVIVLLIVLILLLLAFQGGRDDNDGYYRTSGGSYGGYSSGGGHK